MNASFELSADAKILRTVFEEAAIGDLVTYEKLSAAIGRDVRQHATGAMRTAMKILQREKRFVFANVPKEGYRRLDDAQIVSSMEFDRRRIVRASNRAIRKLECVEFSKLDNDSKRAHTVAAAQMGALQMFSKSSSTKKIAGAVGDKPLAIGETLKLFTT